MRLKNCIVMNGTIIKANSRVNDSIIGPQCKLGRWVCLDNSCVIGQASSREAAAARIGPSRGKRSFDCSILVAEGGPFVRSQGTYISDEVILYGTIVLPHKELKDTSVEPGKIIM